MQRDSKDLDVETQVACTTTNPHRAYIRRSKESLYLLTLGMAAEEPLVAAEASMSTNTRLFWSHKMTASIDAIECRAYLVACMHACMLACMVANNSLCIEKDEPRMSITTQRSSLTISLSHNAELRH
jgi:hypothetical protein